MPRTRLYSFCALFFASIAAGTASHAAAALSGTVSDAAGTAVHIVGHSSNGASSSAAAVVNSSGAYTFPNLAAGSYTIAPRDPNHVFTPNSLFASLESSAVGGLNFTGTETTSPTYKIAGTLFGAVTAGATITLNGANVGAVGTDQGGSYSFSGLAAGTYTVSASLAGHAFSASRTVTITDVDSNENGFDATATPGGSDVVITSVGSMPTATVGKAYSSSALKNISGGEGAYHYQTGPYSTGTPPLGMTVGANGVLSGTPRATGTSTFLLCGSDNYGRVSVACAKTTITVAAVSSTVAPTAPPVTTPPVTTPPVTTSGSVSWVYYNGVFDWPGDFDYAATANYADTSGGPLSGAHDIKIVSSAWGWLAAVRCELELQLEALHQADFLAEAHRVEPDMAGVFREGGRRAGGHRRQRVEVRPRPRCRQVGDVHHSARGSGRARHLDLQVRDPGSERLVEQHLVHRQRRLRVTVAAGPSPRGGGSARPPSIERQDFDASKFDGVAVRLQ